MAENEKANEQVSNYFSQTMVSVLCHPMEYSKVLMQLGYEPLPPRLSRNIIGRQTLLLPNSFQYIKYIKRSDGLLGCFNGLLPTLLGNITSATFSMKVVNALHLDWPEIENPPDLICEATPIVEDYAKYARKEMTLHAVSIVISYPFRVVAVRMMASFIGKEENYQSMFSTIGSIYRDNGVTGFFNGIVPKLIGDLSCISVSVLLAYFVNKYVVTTKECRGYTLPVLTFLTSTVTYPLMLVSTCMAVSGSSLVAGNPPRMPAYGSWNACFCDLLRRRQHKRGGSLFFRYYAGPSSFNWPEAEKKI